MNYWEPRALKNHEEFRNSGLVSIKITAADKDYLSEEKKFKAIQLLT